MQKSLFLAAGVFLALSASAHASATWSCTCRDAEGNDIGSVTVTTSDGASWDAAVRKANKACKRNYTNAADGANCDSE